MKWLPIALAGVHALVCVCIYGLAISDPERSGMMPVILYVADYPVSLLINAVRDALHGDLATEGRFAVDGFAYLVIGSGWYYLLGSLLRASLRKLGQWAAR